MAAILPAVLRECLTSRLTLGGLALREVQELVERTVRHRRTARSRTPSSGGPRGTAVCGGNWPGSLRVPGPPSPRFPRRSARSLGGNVELATIGNGAACQETNKLAGQLGVTRAVLSKAGLGVFRPYQFGSPILTGSWVRRA